MRHTMVSWPGGAKRIIRAASFCAVIGAIVLGLGVPAFAHGSGTAPDQPPPTDVASMAPITNPLLQQAQTVTQCGGIAGAGITVDCSVTVVNTISPLSTTSVVTQCIGAACTNSTVTAPTVDTTITQCGGSAAGGSIIRC